MLLLLKMLQFKKSHAQFVSRSPKQHIGEPSKELLSQTSLGKLSGLSVYRFSGNLGFVFRVEELELGGMLKMPGSLHCSSFLG